jgi:glucose/arabinose dehydrogenase
MICSPSGHHHVSRVSPPAYQPQRAIGRARDITEGPDGAIWFLSVGQDALYRITPD